LQAGWEYQAQINQKSKTSARTSALRSTQVEGFAALLDSRQLEPGKTGEFELNVPVVARVVKKRVRFSMWASSSEWGWS
jgi:hypothetical protein